MTKLELEKQFETFIGDHQRLLYKICHFYHQTVADRNDLYQEIIIQLWNSFPKFRGDSKPSTWLYRVAINTAITNQRRQKDFIRYMEPVKLPVSETNDTTSAELEEQLKTFYEAVSHLNQIERSIVMLYIESKGYEEMEEILGMSQGALRVKMNRVKEKLRQLVKTV